MVKIVDAPNYLNTQYPEYDDEGGVSYSGCAPTVAAMYFAYLKNNGYTILGENRNLPVNYFDAVQSVNSFILHIGYT